MATSALTRGSVFLDISLQDLSGGLNVRDALTEVALNETPDCMNVTLDERGGARKRLGISAWNTPVESLITYGYESSIAGMFWWTKADGRLYRELTPGVLTLVHTFTAGRPVQMTDFIGSVYIAHPVDGLWGSTDGAVWLKVVAATGTVPSGDLVAVWQNKLWMARSDRNQLFFCAPGDVTKWDSADDAGSNYIREGNDYPIVALYGLSGTDIQAQPALLVGKRSGAKGSMHRVTSAATGDYATIDQSVGPAGPNAITNLFGTIYMVSTDGIFSTDGQTALNPVGEKLEPLFRPDALDYTQASGFCAGRQGDRLYFSVARHGAVSNDICYEYNPLFKAFTVRDDAMAVYVNRGTSGDQLLGASPTRGGQVYLLNATGDDDGAPIVSWFTTKVFEPTRSYQTRLQHIRILGRGTFTVSALPNFQTSGKQKQVTIGALGSQWDVDGWDDPDASWGEEVVEGYADFWPRLVGRAFQLRFDETSTLTHANLPLLETGVEQTVGSWALYGCHLSITPLGPS